MMNTVKSETPDAIAPDGSEVRVLAHCDGGSMAHFELAPDQVSVAVAHRTLHEMWYFISGEGEMWRRSMDTGDESTIPVHGGVALTIPARTEFQFRSTGDEPLEAVGATLPPWPGIGEPDGTGEVLLPEGPWTATVESGMSTA